MTFFIQIWTFLKTATHTHTHTRRKHKGKNLSVIRHIKIVDFVLNYINSPNSVCCWWSVAYSRERKWIIQVLWIAPTQKHIHSHTHTYIYIYY